VTRREFSLSSAAFAAVLPTSSYWAITDERIRKFDETVDRVIDQQTTGEKNPWRGGLTDADGLHNGGSAAGLVAIFTTALAQPKSRFRDSALVMQRLRLALGFLDRHTSPDGNIHLLFTNFNSPPDTAFAMYSLCAAAHLARQAKLHELEGLLEPVVKRHAGGLLKGGVHTPNHRWVVCAGLAQAHALYPNPEYVHRIDQWLAEGIDIDADGQYTERSTATYNGVTNRALVTTAIKLNRPELLAPVRRNLDAMQYLLHPGMEVVTDISTRQDQYTPGTMAGYWFAARHLALIDNNPLYEAYARQGAPALWELMEYPELQKAGPDPGPVPENYEKLFPALGVARIRRGRTSATILLSGSSRFLALRHGAAVLQSVRFSSAFFGKGQFVPTKGGKSGDAYEMEQHLEGPYYQPLARAVEPGPENWAASRTERARTEVSRLSYRASVSEFSEGFRIRIRADGTRHVPLTVELAFRPGGQFEHVEPLSKLTDAYLLKSGFGAYRVGRDVIRFGTGRADHGYVVVRGAEPRVPGATAFLTAFTPVDQTIEFRLD
jgi:hypothetical protein